MMSVCMMVQIVVPTNYRDHGHNHLYGKDSDGDNEQIMGRRKWPHRCSGLHPVCLTPRNNVGEVTANESNSTFKKLNNGQADKPTF